MCDVAYALLVEKFTGDWHAVLMSGDGQPPPDIFEMVDEALTADGPAGSEGRIVSPELRELEEALGVG